MADDLVVREWDHTDWRTWGTCTAEHNAVVRAYLERDAQLAEEKARLKCEPHLCQYGNHRDYYQIKDALAAMTAERDDLQRRNDTLAEIIGGEETSEVQNYEIVDVADLQAQLAAMTAERDAALAMKWHWIGAADFKQRQVDELLDQLTASEAARERLTKAVEAVVSSLSASSYTRQLCEKALAETGEAGSDV